MRGQFMYEVEGVKKYKKSFGLAIFLVLGQDFLPNVGVLEDQLFY